MAGKTKTKAGVLVIHCSGKKATLKKDKNLSKRINDFVVDKMRIGSFQLLTEADESGKIVPMTEVGSYTGTDLYIRERNKAQ